MTNEMSGTTTKRSANTSLDAVRWGRNVSVTSAGRLGGRLATTWLGIAVEASERWERTVDTDCASVDDACDACPFSAAFPLST